MTAPCRSYYVKNFYKFHHRYTYKEFIFLYSEVASSFLRNALHIFISTYRRGTRAPCVERAGKRNISRSLLKCTDSFLCAEREEESLWERRSHPVGYRRGRWATNNSMCAYKLIRLPTTLLPLFLRRGAPARPSIRPGSNSFEFVLRPPWRRRRRITPGLLRQRVKCKRIYRTI